MVFALLPTIDSPELFLKLTFATALSENVVVVVRLLEPSIPEIVPFIAPLISISKAFFNLVAVDALPTNPVVAVIVSDTILVADTLFIIKSPLVLMDNNGVANPMVEIINDDVVEAS